MSKFREQLTELLLPLVGQELYIEISSSVSCKMYLSNVDEITFHEGDDKTFDYIELLYADSVFTIWDKDIEEILNDDSDFIDENEEYDEDFKFVTGMYFDSGMTIYIYRNIHNEEE